MGIALVVVILLVLLILGAALWVSPGRQKSRRERTVGQTMVTLGIVGLLLVVGLIYFLGRIL